MTQQLSQIGNRETGQYVRGLVSVIIPCFNDGRFLGQAVQSVLAQTYPHREIIVVDDGSTDDTPEVAGSFGTQIKYVRQENQGLSAARNAGLVYATGEYVNFLDADDVLLPEMLTRILPPFKVSGTGVTYCGTIRTNETLDKHLEVYFPALPNDVFSTLAQHSLLLVHSLVVRHALVNRVGQFDVRLRACEDWDLWIRVARLGVTFVPIREPLVLYRAKSGSLGRNARLVFNSAKTVILRAHGHDDRVPRGSLHDAGRQADPAPVIRHYAAHAACLAIAQNDVRTACDLLETLQGESGRALVPSDLMDLMPILHQAAGVETSDPELLWARVGSSLLAVLQHEEFRQARPGLAVACLLSIGGCARLGAELEGARRELRAIKTSRTWRFVKLIRRCLPSLGGAI